MNYGDFNTIWDLENFGANLEHRKFLGILGFGTLGRRLGGEKKFLHQCQAEI